MTEHGFTLIELLVVLALVAILSVIAIPQYGQYAQRSADGSMHATLNAARQAMEAFYEANDFSYGGSTVPRLETYGLRVGEEVQLEIVAVASSSYTVRACAGGGSFPSWVFDSSAGSFSGDASSCGATRTDAGSVTSSP